MSANDSINDESDRLLGVSLAALKVAGERIVTLGGGFNPDVEEAIRQLVAHGVDESWCEA